jgi:hypothetical protein
MMKLLALVLIFSLQPGYMYWLFIAAALPGACALAELLTFGLRRLSQRMAAPRPVPLLVDYR